MIVCNIFGLLIWSVRTAHGPGDLINSASTESGSVLGWNVIYGIQAILGLWSGGIVGQSGTGNIFYVANSSNIDRLDTLRQNPERIPLWARRYMSLDHQRYCSMRPHHHFSEREDLRCLFLESFRTSAAHPIRINEPRSSRRDILLRPLFPRFPDGIVHRSQRHFHWYGYGCPVSKMDQYPSRLLHTYYHRCRYLSLELC